MRPRVRLLGVVALFVTGAALWIPPSSSGDTEAPVWTCRASAGYVRFPAQHQRVEPVVANGGTTDPNPETNNPGNIDRAQCVDDDAGFPTLRLPPEPDPCEPGCITIQAPFARTRIEGDLADARSQTTSAAGGVAKLRIQDAEGTFVLTADVTDADATASCQGGVPTLSATSRVVNLKLGDNGIPIEDALIPIFDGINGSPLVALLRIDVHEEIVEGDASSQSQSLTRRALHVQLLTPEPAEPPMIDVVVGEAKVDRTGAVCAPPEPPPVCPAGTTEVSRQDDGSVTCQQVVQTTAPCPQGTQQDPSGACVRIIVVQQQAEVLPPCPAGQARDVDDVCRPIPRSRCTNSAFGRQFTILGTNRRDRITGTNRADTILAFGGGDRVSGGRGNDCVEGGSGNDNVDGSNNNDLMFGGTGRDIMNGGTGRDRLFGDPGNDTRTGGSGNDRLDGGAGRDRLSGGLGNDRMFGGDGKDYINTGNGRDVINGGSGNDAINASTAGPAVRVDCGPGIDSLRINGNERTRHRNCERVLVARR